MSLVLLTLNVATFIFFVFAQVSLLIMPCLLLILLCQD